MIFSRFPLAPGESEHKAWREVKGRINSRLRVNKWIAKTVGAATSTELERDN